ncbi:MAG: MFS transporter [Gammaproteobacteria bacterium]|nr:MFS transporter [Gammaproteobacteria bacterium]
MEQRQAVRDWPGGRDPASARTAADASEAGARLGPIELAPGVTRSHVLVKLVASFVGISALSGMAILQSYILTAHLHVPRAMQGTLTGDLAFWSEVVGLLLFIPFGMAADRIGRRPLLSFGFVMLALGWGLYPFATTTGELLAYRIVYAIGAAATAGTLAVLVNDYPRDSSRGKLIGFTSFCNTLGTMFMAGVVGRIPELLTQRGYDAVTGGRAMYLTGAALCAVMAFVCARGLMAGTPAGRAARPPPRELAAAIGRAVRNPRIAIAYAGALVARSDVVVKGLFLSLWAIQAGRAEGMSPGRAIAQFGTMITIMYVVSLVSAPVFGWFIDRVHRMTAMIVALATASTGYLSMRYMSSPLDFSMIPMLVVLTLGTGFMVKASAALIGQEAPVRERSSVIAGSSVCGALGILVFTAVGGRVFDAWGPWAPFVVVGFYQAALLVAAVLVRRLAPGPAAETRRLPT